MAPSTSGERPLSHPTTGSPACCAPAASGHTAATLPSSVMNSRHRNGPIRIRFPPPEISSQHIELAAISQWGGLGGVRSTSISGNNPGSQAFPGGAKSRREQVQQTTSGSVRENVDP